MSIFKKDTIVFVFDIAFIFIVLVYLTKLSYIVRILEKKHGVTEGRLRKIEQNLSEYVMRTEALNRELETTRLEMLANQCQQLAKNRLVRRDFRVLMRKMTNISEQAQDRVIE
jgi:hypothetical protein